MNGTIGRRPAPRFVPNSATGPARRGVWWLSPVTVVLCVVPIAVLSTALIGDDSFREQWRTPKSITLETCLLLLSGGLLVALGAALVSALRPAATSTVGPTGPARRWPDLTDAQVGLLRRFGRIVFWLTVLGYAAFVVSGLRSGITAAQVLAAFGAEGVYDGEIKQRLGTIPGLTTLTQFGIASVVVSSLLLAHSPAREQRIQLLVVLGLALPRAFLLTERLAVLELVVPVVVVAAMRWSGTPTGRRRTAAVPFVVLPLLLAVFAVFEYSRSWVFFRGQADSSFLRFAAERLVGYYTTAVNNGALELAHHTYPGRLPYETISWFWTAPGIEGAYARWSGQDNVGFYTDILVQHATPEFNNSSGLAAPLVDYGVVGGLVYLLLAGVVLGLLHRAFVDGRPVGLLVYPVVFIGVVELPRYLAWAQGRLFPALVGLLVLAVLLSRLPARVESAR